LPLKPPATGYFSFIFYDFGGTQLFVDHAKIGAPRCQFSHTSGHSPSRDCAKFAVPWPQDAFMPATSPPPLSLRRSSGLILKAAFAALLLAWAGGASLAAQDTPPVFVVRAHSTHLGPEGGYLKDNGGSRVLVFVHSFGSGPDSDFRCDNDHNWPEMIAGDVDPVLSSTDIYVLGYPEPPRRGKTAVAALESSLVDRMTAAGIFTRHQQVVFVAHAMGGLLIQQILEQNAQSDWSHRVGAVFLFGTPQGSAKLAGLGRYLDADPRLKEMERNGNNFILHSESPVWSGIPHICAYEAVSDDGFSSANNERYTRGCTDRRAIQSNRANIVKPCQVTDPAYAYLEEKLHALFPQH
jgi:pimeloyl-ACP methyl ester carboxylesterase